MLGELDGYSQEVNKASTEYFGFIFEHQVKLERHRQSEYSHNRHGSRKSKLNTNAEVNIL